MAPLPLGPFPHRPGHDRALELDASDPLREHRAVYQITDPELIYLDSNSLGRLPKQTVRLMNEVVEHQWGDRLIRSWNEGWWDLQLRLGAKLAPLIGARPEEVIFSDSTSVNLFKLADAALTAAQGRKRIVTDSLNFPSDVYVLDGVARRHGGELEMVAVDQVADPEELVLAAINDQTALVSLSHTAFASGYTYDMVTVTRAAHEAGAITLWDCSHSVGAMGVDLGGAHADLAIGCGYKYLNGGPGAPAFLYVRRDLQDHLANPITAWWGHADPFALELEFRPVTGIRRFHTGTMPILSLAAIEPGLDDMAAAGIERIRAKSVALSDFLIELHETYLEPLEFRLVSPRTKERRGSHVALAHDDAWPITRALIEVARVIPDFRAPDILRLGLSPLYTTFLDVHTAVCRLADLVAADAHQDFVGATFTVT